MDYVTLMFVTDNLTEFSAGKIEFGAPVAVTLISTMCKDEQEPEHTC